MVWTDLMGATACGGLLGACVGLWAGLVPGLHTNNLSLALTAAPQTFLAGLAWLAVAPAGDVASPAQVASACGFLMGMTLGHAFTDEIPAIFLGAPDPETSLSVLPGHRLLVEGLGPAAVRATALGSLLGATLSLLSIPFIAGALGPPLHLYGAAAGLLPYLLFGVAAALVLSEGGSPRLSRRHARLLGAGLLVLSGALGEVVIFAPVPLPNWFPLGVTPAQGPTFMLALFGGMFGLPTLLLAARSAAPLPPPAPGGSHFPLPRSDIAKAAVAGTAAGAAVGWLPGVGAAQASVLAKLASDRFRARASGELELRGPREAAHFLVTQSAVGAANLMFNLVALFALLRIRSGTMNAMAQVGGSQVSRWVDLAEPPDLFIALLVSVAVALPLCYAAAIGLGGLCSRLYLHLPPRALAATVFVALVALTLLLEGAVGLALCACALSLGMVPPLAGVKRVHLMGAILLPVAIRLMFVA